MEIIGQGGVWKIYKIENQNNVFRIPKYFSENSINQFIENYKLIKKTGLPTLKRVEKYEIDGKVGIICDNVNCSEEVIYVTYNSLYSDSQKLLDLLSKNILGDREERRSSLAEDFRYKNKIHELTNFEEFLKNITIDLKHATQQDILIEFDSYFFGTQKHNSITKIDYKIVDLDHIFTNTNRNEVDLYNLNLSELSMALKGFIKYFVFENSQKVYFDYLETKNYA